ncbi:ThuA domain-containing protein [Alteromonadaceae bacterium BrNp21-10]|nr:ThuA domain-containing protein [Alteromonadaceae bacterium BrNp21-10]
MKSIFKIIALSLLVCLSAQAKQFNVLLFSKTDGFHHTSINAGVTAIEKLAERHFFNVEWHEDAGKFNAKDLARFDAVIFLNTTGNILNEEQQAAFETFYKSGKGFVGIHSATDTEYEWEWYTKLIGRLFVIHPTNQTAKVDVLDRSFPGVERMPDSFLWTDEWYQFGPEKVKGLNYILSIDETSYDPKADWGRVKGDGMGDFHPISWYHEFDGGRSFYTNIGHLPTGFSDEIFLNHLFGGIFWAATGKGLGWTK